MDDFKTPLGMGFADGMLEDRELLGGNLPPGGDMGPWAFQNYKDKRDYQLGVYRDPNKWIWFEHPTHRDFLNKDVAGKFINTAMKYGIDPYKYLALGISETRLGNNNYSNPTQIRFDIHRDRIDKLYPLNSGMSDQDVAIDYGGRYLKEMLDKYKGNELAGLQAYSGTGQVLYGGKAQGKFFGRNQAGLRVWDEHPQANRIVDIAGRIRKMPEFIDLVNSYQNSGEYGKE